MSNLHPTIVTMGDAFRCLHQRGLLSWESAHNERNVKRAHYYYRKHRDNPGDCRGDDALLMGMAIAESMVGHGPGWIPHAQRLGCDYAKALEAGRVTA